MAWYDIFTSNSSYDLPPEIAKYLKGLRKGGGIQNKPGYQQGLGYLQSLFDDSSESFDQFSEPAMRQFQQQIVPQIAERFSLGNEKNSSAFQNTLAQAGANLSALLGQQREQMKQQSLPQLLSYLGAPSQQYQNALYGAPWQQQQNPWGQVASGLGNIGSQLALQYLLG